MTTPSEFVIACEDFSLDLNARPWRAEVGPRKRSQNILKVCAVLLVVQMIPAWIEAGPWAALASLIAAMALALFVRRRAGRKGSIVVDDGTVTVELRYGSDVISFSEPLRAYQAVRYRETTLPAGMYGSGSRTHCYIELVHPDEARTVPVLSRAGHGQFRARLAEYANAFALPAREMDSGRQVRHEADDLDKSLRERIDEGTVKAEFDPTKTPPEGLLVTPGTGAIEIVLPVTWVPWFAIAGLLAISAGFSLPMWLEVEVETAFDLVMVAAVGVAVFCCAVGVFVLGVVRRRVIRITDTHLERGHRFPMFGYWAAEKYALADIETVSVHAPGTLRTGRTTTYTAPKLRIVGKGQQIDTGLGLKKEALEWLRDTLTAAIGNA